MADLDAALARKDLFFAPAVVLYGARSPNDAKRAGELDALLRRVARMKDDPTIPLPFPPGAFAAAANPAAGSSVQPSGVAPAAKAIRLNFGGGHNRDEKDK